MRFKGFWYDSLLISLAAVCAAAFTVVTFFIEPKLALAECIAVLAIVALMCFRVLSAKSRYKKFLLQAAKSLDYTDTEVLASLPFPVAVCDGDGYIKWAGESFIRDIAGGELTETSHIDEFSNGVGLQALLSEEKTGVFVGGRYYSVYTLSYESGGEKCCILYYLDYTELKQTELEYHMSRPYVILIKTDNLGDSRTDFRDSERAEIRSSIEAMLDEWSDSYGSTINRINDDRYMIVTERRNVERMTQDRFSVHDSVRNFEYKGRRANVTLSMGVATGEDIITADKLARKALRMALSRGGDQIAIYSEKEKNSYVYIGGKEEAQERPNRVSSRIIGSSLAELIRGSENVVIVGHSYTDFDAVGAAVGLAYAARSMDVPAYVATDTKKTLAEPLIEKLGSEGFSDLFIGGDRAAELLGKKSLLIVVDTHIRSFIEFPELYNQAKRRVIIDHHRLTEPDDGSAEIFHHDPGASSASEMVADMLEYIVPDINIPRLVAEALLAGIMLDTKCFVIRAGVRTFEAAAYLKGKGADLVSVKRLFSNSMDVSRLRNRAVSSAESFDGCAISAIDFDSPDVRVIAAQAADELLNVSGVKASFVMFKSDGAVNISARSFGDINVQLIMEALGGGGHQTMAACRLKDFEMQDARSALRAAIEDYKANNSK